MTVTLGRTDRIAQIRQIRVTAQWSGPQVECVDEQDQTKPGVD